MATIKKSSRRIKDDEPASCERCGWSGFGRDLEFDVFEEIVETSCPKCDAKIEILHG